eukprot:scaffold2627_cov140-Amphora_coffeaeformis.AAC.3
MSKPYLDSVCVSVASSHNINDGEYDNDKTILYATKDTSALLSRDDKNNSGGSNRDDDDDLSIQLRPTKIAKVAKLSEPIHTNTTRLSIGTDENDESSPIVRGNGMEESEMDVSSPRKTGRRQQPQELRLPLSPLKPNRLLLSPPHEVNVSWVRMTLCGNPNARRLVKHFLPEVLTPLRGVLENPYGYYANQLVIKPPGKYQRGVYFARLLWQRSSKDRALGQGQGQQLPATYVEEKIGSSARIYGRLEEDYKKDTSILKVLEFRVVAHMDMLNKATDEQFQQLVYHPIMQKLTTDPTIHPFQRQFFDTIYRRGGGAPSLKDSFARQIVEAACQAEWNVSSPQVCLAFDESVYDRIFQLTESIAERSLQAIATILECSDSNGRRVWLEAMASWPHGYTHNKDGTKKLSS